MTSREIVEATLEFSGPTRVARSFGDSDFVGAGCRAKTHATPWRQVDDERWEMTDEWGNVWGRVDPTSKGEVTRGVLSNWADLDDYEFPDFSRAEDYDGVRAVREQHPDKWLLGGMPGFTFNVARKFRRLDTYFVDLYLEREHVRRLHDRIDAVLCDMIRNFAEAGVDSVFFPEDWGTQDRLLVNPDLWWEEFFPRFVRLCGLARDMGIRVFMHSCGQTEAIVPGLMQAGVSLLQFDQPQLHGVDNLASHQDRGKITFWCPVDIQTTLQSRDESLIRASARELLDRLWRGRGGFVAGFYGDNVSIGLDPVYQEAACDEFVRYGVAERASAVDG